MILRVVHAAVPPEKRPAYVDFITNKLAPAVRKMPGCHFLYVGECVEKQHEHEVIYLSGWDTEEQCEALEKTTFIKAPPAWPRPSIPTGTMMGHCTFTTRQSPP